MSFRLRVLVLVALVATVATGVTAWLSLQQASRQITESADAQRDAVDEIAEALTGYGRAHGTWEGVATLVDELGSRTGQRIKVQTEYGEVLVDTDTLAGWSARPVDSPPVPVDARPALSLPDSEWDPRRLGDMTVEAIGSYRSGVLFAACLTRNGYRLVATEGRYGLPQPAPDPAGALASGPTRVPDTCVGRSGDGEWEQDADAVDACVQAHPQIDFLVRTGPGSVAVTPQGGVDVSGTLTDPPPERLTRNTRQRQQLELCLAGTFVRRTESVAPEPLHVYFGAVDEQRPSLSPVPVLAAASLVAALAIAGSVLLSRRVLRPIRALTAASRRLGAGDLTERVPVAGRDELAELARSFNRMADSLQRGEDRQRRLVADVAHELRTPLANVRGYLEALRDGVVAPEPELFASLYEEAVLQQRVVDDLQELALAEAGSLIYHRTPVELGELLEVSRAAHQAAAEAAGVALVVEAGPPVVANVDPDRLRQVLGNLISNAVRATPPGGRVELAAGSAGTAGTAASAGMAGTASSAGARAVITVTDTGTGISREHVPHVFDRFWRADAARGRNTGGSGLGLAIARQIVVDHGGTIDVASEAGAGTTFTIRLPAAPPDRSVRDGTRP